MSQVLCSFVFSSFRAQRSRTVSLQRPLFKSEPSSRATDARAGVRGQVGGARATRPAEAGAGGTFVLGSVFPATPLLPPH